MTKIPAGKTIIFAYGFLFGQIGTVISAAGIPAAVYAGADYASRAFAAAQGPPDGDAGPSDAAIFVGFLALIVEVFATSTAAIAVTRVVFAQMGAPPRLSFAASAIRMAGANMRFIAGAAALIVLAAGVSYIGYRLSGVPLGGALEFQPTVAIFLAALVSWAMFLYAFVSIVRMGFLLPAVVAAEAKGGLKRSHDLTQGNIWRVIAIAFALGLPVLILGASGAYAMVRSVLGPDFVTVALTPELVARARGAIAERLLAWEVFNAVIFVLYSGLVYSGVAFAYRAIAPSRDKPVL